MPPRENPRKAMSNPKHQRRACSALAAATVMWIGTITAGELPSVSTGDNHDLPVTVHADKVEFEREHNLVRADGHVTIQRGNDILRADRVTLHTGTRQAHASGNVVFSREDLEWKGERFAYNFSTRRWASGPFTAFIDPFHITSAAAENMSETEFQVQQATVTTCELPGSQAHYRLRSGRVRIRPEDHLLAHHAVLHLGSIPVFYLPVWRMSLDQDFGFQFQPGHRGRMGTYLLSSYRYRIDPTWRGQTHLDYRSRRGPAIGQDLRWDDPIAGTYSGAWSGYHIWDRNPYLGQNPETVDIDESRHRLQLRHRQQFSFRDTLLMRLETVSDALVREDFFERDYRRFVQPDNFVAITHRRDELAFGVLARMRLNDFYEHIDRLPEVSLDIHRRRLGDSPLYYENRNTATILRHRWPETQALDEVAVNRIDSRHLLTWPMRAFGFLSLMPRIGGQATYYSDTFKTVAVQQALTSSTTNQIVTAAGATNILVTSETQTVTNQVRQAAGGAVRTSVELGIEASFQAARIWETGPAAWGRDLRHVVEPYVNYTFIPEPSLTPDRLHPFDDTDRLDQLHAIGFGIRNVLQTKRNQRSHDLLDVNIFSSYRLDANTGEDALGPLGLRAEARPADHWGMDITAVYNPETATLDEFNGHWHYRKNPWWRAQADYRYRSEQSRLVSGTLTVMPNRDWTFEAYGRYEAEESRIEEHAWFAQRNLDCMAIRTGLSHLPAYTRADGSDREDEYRITLEVWLTAFPEMRTGFARRQ